MFAAHWVTQDLCQVSCPTEHSQQALPQRADTTAWEKGSDPDPLSAPFIPKNQDRQVRNQTGVEPTGSGMLGMS